MRWLAHHFGPGSAPASGVITAPTDGRARCARGILTALRLAAPPLRLRHTAGCRPSVTPDAVRHRLAAVTPAARAPTWDAPSSRRPSMKPRKTAVKGALRASLA